MKRYLFFVFLCFIQLQSRAQQVLYSQDFEYYNQTNFSYPWEVTGSAGFFTWSCGADYQIGGLSFPITDNTTRVAGIKGYGIDSQVRLITPAFSLAAAQNGAFFKYKSFFKKNAANGKTESAIIEITTDNGVTWTAVGSAPVSTGNHYSTSLINISAFAGAGSVRIGFRYSDSGIGGTGWMIDDLSAFVPAPHDIALQQILPSDSLAAFAVQGSGIPLSGIVQNMGTQPITAFDIAYEVGNGPVISQSYTGLNLAPLATMPFNFAQAPVMPGVGRFNVKVWAVTVADAFHANDSISLKAFGASFIPQKVVVVEEGTGAWHSVAPQQHVIMDDLKGTDYPVNLISIHHGDPMGMNSYINYLTDLHQCYIPYFLLDRSLQVTPTTIVTLLVNFVPQYYGLFNSSDVFDPFYRFKDYFGYAELKPSLQINGTQLTVSVKVKPAISLLGDYRLALVLTENNITNTDAAYNQANLFANNAFGQMGGYEMKPDPVPAADMKYNFVARSITPSPDGAAGVLPTSLQADNTYNATLSATLNQAAWVQGKLSATVLLLNGTDGTVLNSAAIPIPSLGNTDLANNTTKASLYPNPATSSANLLYYLNTNSDVMITIADMMGKEVSSIKKANVKAGNQNMVIRTDSFAAGTYIVTIRSAEAMQSLKLTILGK